MYLQFSRRRSSESDARVLGLMRIGFCVVVDIATRDVSMAAILCCNVVLNHVHPILALKKVATQCCKVSGIGEDGFVCWCRL